MKKLIIIFLLTFSPVLLVKNAMATDAVTEFTKQMESESKDMISGTSKSFEQSFEAFKKDPVGQMKIYWEDLKVLLSDLVKMIQDGYAELMKKAG